MNIDTVERNVKRLFGLALTAFLTYGTLYPPSDESRMKILEGYVDVAEQACTRRHTQSGYNGDTPFAVVNCLQKDPWVREYYGLLAKLQPSGAV